MVFSRSAFVSLQSLLRTADYLKIKGLCELSENLEETNRFLNATLATSNRIPQKRAKVSLSAQAAGVHANPMVRSSTIRNHSHSFSNTIEEVDLTKGEYITTTIKDDQPKHDRLTGYGQQNSSTPINNKTMASLGMGLGMVSVIEERLRVTPLDQLFDRNFLSSYRTED